MSDNLHKYVLALSAARDRNVVLTIKVNALESELHEYVGAMQGILKVLKGDKIVHSTLIKEVEDAADAQGKELAESRRKLEVARKALRGLTSHNWDAHEWIDSVEKAKSVLAEIGEE